MKTSYIVLAVILCVCLVGCRQQEEDSPEMPADTNEMSMVMPDAESMMVTDAMLAKLTFADAADGTADHVVAKCVMCKLSMDGKAEFAETVGDYTVHLCSSMCQEGFHKDPSKALLALAEE